ncbi:hypothetical protein NS228_03860 [Methylobacterium indicum]|uniref:Uncharacterized protein n=1 Tax=Methylobacterium indicum TaxID=1775910 RepID=A0A0J6UFM5_9HYPH|nr:hypothetical protein [Methylobacterium indicum]KMO15801.1 hypothetical protein QR78_20530 [Methylobacterium indicum]KMO24591.1 hypothetical protein QR79_11280 [Methylobacterium indicum]KTS22783.1 hypothetical protein NS229_22930 [Methylobacterium indicum]KTS42160.1 hypothetical protein NS228_03860 [Methylobacterium indicum]KTS52577.1 hypothetical protein NS230_09165 [Methylobacterium indicum]
MTARCLRSLGTCSLGAVLTLGVLAAPAQAQTAAPQDEGNPFVNIFKYGGTTKPPEAPPSPDDVYCPIIDVTEGGSSLQTMAGGTVRTQIRLGQLSRACRPGPNGGTVVSVGVQGVVLLGPGGAPGRFNAPVSITVKNGTQILARRTHQGAVTIPAGQASGSFTVIEDGIVVPAAQAKDFDIEVGLGAIGKPARAPRRKQAAPPPADG